MSRQIRQIVAVEDRRQSLVALLSVILEKRDRSPAQRENGGEVDGHHDAGEQVRECPDDADLTQRTTQHTEAHEEPVCGHHFVIPGEELNVGFTVVVVSDDRRESEEEDNHRHQVDSPVAHGGRNRVLG